MPDPYDLIVVGGGCNGTGIARDAAMRGISVLLVEKYDFAAGTTGASSGMIHGGPRYLQYEVGTTKKACRDAGYIRKIAPHLCFRIPFLVPVMKEGRPRWRNQVTLELMETFFEVYDRFSALKGGQSHTRLSGDEVRSLEPAIPPDVEGAVTFDEWGIDTNRLCVANALAAAEYGAQIKNHTEVTRVLREGNRVTGVRVRNVVTGEATEHRAQIVFNATGPWSPQFAKLAGVRVLLRPAKGIHLILDRRLTNMAIVSKCIDGRQIFINPHENNTVVGTTDDDYYGDLDDIPVTQDEIEYLLEGIESVFPEVRQARVISTWRGVRPTIYGRDCYEDELSREHEIIDHSVTDRVEGFISMIGGKLASYREMAQEATDLVAKKLKISVPCRTHHVALPGGEAVADVGGIAERCGIDSYVVRRLSYRQGHKTEEILNQVCTQPREKTIVCPCEPVTIAELRHCIRHEWAEGLSDLFRRTRLGAGPCQGALCAVPAAACLAEEKQWSARQTITDLEHFIDFQWRARKDILSGEQLAQEEINQAVFCGTLQLQNLALGRDVGEE